VTPPTDPVVLSTPRLRLDQPGRDDAPAIARICADPSIGRWIPVMPQPYRLTDALGWVDGLVPQGWRTGSEPTWVLRLPDGAVIGSVGVHVGRQEIGYWLGTEHRGHGYMTEAVAAVLDWWFARGADRVVWRCLPGNAPSVAVARAAGFTYRGTAPAGHPQAGQDGREYWYAVLHATDPRTPRPGWPER
jgi:RimJ/RimL family protein N-acetyltransferase